MKPADTPERLAHLQTLTQREIVPHKKDGQTQYVFADAQGCKCLYAGSEAQYETFQGMVAEQQVALDPVAAAALNDDAPMDWGLWEW